MTEALVRLRGEAGRRVVALLFGSRETEVKNAVALKRILER